jgi:hypothetical protein
VTRHYPLEPLRLRVFYVIAAVSAIIGLLLAAFFFWVVADLGLDVIGLILVASPLVVFGGIALMIVLAARSIRLELSEAGVTLQLPGARMTAAWDDVESVGPAIWGPLTGREALKLRQPARVDQAWLFTLFAGPEYQSAIPLGPFAVPLAGSRLEADLRSRLPDLFARQMPGS